MGIDFWTGAMIVVVATGVYTIFGGLRPCSTRTCCRCSCCHRRVVVTSSVWTRSAGGTRSSRPSGPSSSTCGSRRRIPTSRGPGSCSGADPRRLVLVHRPVHRPARAGGQGPVEARRGAIFAGFLKLLPLFIFVLPGIIAHALAESGRLTLEAPDQALPALIGALLPAGLRGLVVAGLLAALMSSLSSVFNSSSTLVTGTSTSAAARRDRAAARRAGSRHGVLVGFGLAWIPFMKQISGQLYQYLQSVQAYISPPIAAVFLLGILWPRVNAKARSPRSPRLRARVRASGPGAQRAGRRARCGGSPRSTSCTSRCCCSGSDRRDGRREPRDGAA